MSLSISSDTGIATFGIGDWSAALFFGFFCAHAAPDTSMNIAISMATLRLAQANPPRFCFIRSPSSNRTKHSTAEKLEAKGCRCMCRECDGLLGGSRLIDLSNAYQTGTERAWVS